MEVICLEEKAFYALIEKVVSRIEGQRAPAQDRWVSGPEAMRLLRISSKTTLQKLRDEGRIRFSQPDKRIILYDTQSIAAYLEQHTRETF